MEKKNKIRTNNYNIQVPRSSKTYSINSTSKYRAMEKLYDINKKVMKTAGITRTELFNHNI